MRFSLSLTWRAWAAVAALTACGDAAVVVEVAGANLAVPEDIDGLCLAVTDVAASGGTFGRQYRSGADFDSLPQTLVVDPGSATLAEVWARGTRFGREVTRASANLDFSEDVTLSLESCAPAMRGVPEVVATTNAPSDTAFASSYGFRGGWLVGAASGSSRVFRTVDGSLAPIGVAEPLFAISPHAIVAGDLDGDCADDLLAVERNAPPSIWLRDGIQGFFEAPERVPAGAAAARAAALGDIDGDGDLDAMIVGETGGQLWLSVDGGFAIVDSALDEAGALDGTSIALGDIDADGVLDAVVGRGSASAVPAAVHLGNGDGTFTYLPDALPGSSWRTRAVSLEDVTGDGLADLFVVASGQPVRLLVNLGDGTFEDRSADSLPTTVSIAGTGLAVGDWNGDCVADVVVAVEFADVIAWRGVGDGTFVEDDPVGVSALQVFLADGGAGYNDLFVVGADGLTWVGR